MAELKEKNWTYSEYITLDDGKQYEINEGMLLEMSPAPAWKHQKIAMRLTALLDDFVFKNQLGEVFAAPCDVVLSEINVYQPDVFFVSKDNLDIIKEKDIQGIPDLVIEILSPGSINYDRVDKYNSYETFKIKEYWIIDPEKRCIEVYNLKNDKFLQKGIFGGDKKVESKSIPGIEICFNKLAERIS